MEIGLDLKVFAAKMVSGFLKEVWAGESGDGNVAKLEESVRSLEEEKRKVEAFKRELPLCMHLLTDVIEALKKDLDQWRGQRFARVFGELVSIKSELGDSAMAEEKKSWMCSAQLWRDSNGGSNRKEAKNEEKMLEKRGGGFDCLRRRESLKSKSLTGGGAFVPFKALSGLPEISKERAPAITLSTLSLPAPPLSNATLALSPAGSCSKGVGGAPESAPATAGDHLSTQVQQQPRKVRRCWSPELHRHFLSALEQLGGAQVATPKQIRELMKVEGLTNDEVKSHLQKYRLHSRGKPKSSEPINQPLPASGVATSSEEQHSTSSQQSGSQSGSPQSPLQLAWPTRVGCEEEHGRSESHSWK